MESIQSQEIELGQNKIFDQDLRGMEEAKSHSEVSDISEADGFVGEDSSDDSMKEEYKSDSKDNFFFGIWLGSWLRNFGEVPGPKNLPVGEELTPLIVFSLLFSDDLISLIQNTNKYARAYISS